MNQTMQAFHRLETAEDYLRFFGIDYDPQVVHVNRLHILKKFSQYLEEIDRAAGDLSDAERLARYRQAMERAYGDFIHATALDHRVFKVLKEHTPAAFVPLSRLARAARSD